MESQNILHEATAQYNDLKGTIAIGFEGSPDNFDQFVRELNVIDFDIFFPVGLELNGYRNNKSICSIICVNRKDAPIGDKEDIPVTIFQTDIPMALLENKIKYLSIVLHSPYRSAGNYIIEKTVESKAD